MKRILSVLLVALMLVGMLPMHALNAHAAETATETLAIKANTGTMSGTASISWSGDNVTFTNYKASSSTAIRTSDSDHYRVYGNSEVEVTAPGNITKIVITSTSSSYVTPWKNSAGKIGTATSSGNAITVVPTTPAETIKFAASAQVRLNKVEVTYEVAGGATECEHSFVNGVCSICGETRAVVSFSLPSQVAGVDSLMADENGAVTLPAADDYTGDHAKYDYTFAGWATKSVSDTTDAPTLYTAGSQYTTTENVTLYAVYTYTVAGSGGSTEFVLTDAANIKPGDTVVITTTKDDTNYYAMSNGNGTSKAPTATKVTVSGGKLADSNNLTSLKWDIGGTEGAYIFYVSGGTSSWLYCTSTNNGVRVGTNTGNTFKIDSSSGYLVHNNTNRYIGIYNSADWRCYTSVNSNITGQTLCFFVQTSGGADDYYTSTLEDVDSTCSHTNTTETTVDATCTEDGSVTVTCEDCGAEISMEVITAPGHTAVVDAAKDPTCVDTGLTEGSHCSVCNAVIVAQQTVPATGVHTFVDGACSVCGEAEPTTGSTAWQLVTDVNEIIAGGQFVVVGTYGNANYALPTTISGKMTGVAVTVADNKVVFVEGTTPVWTVEGCGNGIALYNGTSYLKYGSSTNLASSTTPYEFTLTAVGDAFKVASTVTNTRGVVFRTGADYNVFGGYALSNVSATSTDYVGIKFYKLVNICDHKNIVDVAEVPATCTTVGYTAGKQCADCGTYTEGHTLIEMISHSYNDGVQTTAPGCETTGVKTYSCTVCGKEWVETIPALGHTEVVDEAVAPTCTDTGLTEGIHCSVCNEVLTAQEEIAALGHTEVVDEAVVATCTATGLTEGVHCSVCNAVLTAQEEVPALGHNMVSEAAYNEKNVPCITHQCSRCDEGQTIAMKYNAASVTLANTLIVNFWTPADMGGTAQYAGFENVSATFTYGKRIGENAITVDISEAELRGDVLVFPCRYITPSQIGDTITATLTGTYQGEEFTYTMEYGVAKYCYNMLNNESTTDAKLRTLLVDLLYYCDAARTYTTYKADELVTDALTEAQKAERTTTDPELSSVLNGKYAVVENAKAKWKSASLIMAHATRMRFRFEMTADVSSLTVKALVGGEERTAYIVEEDGQCYVYVDDLSGFEMRETVYVTLYEGETAVSNTITYSIETYACNKQNDADADLAALVKAMMRYGDSAIEYRN